MVFVGRRKRTPCGARRKVYRMQRARNLFVKADACIGPGACGGRYVPGTVKTVPYEPRLPPGPKFATGVQKRPPCQRGRKRRSGVNRLSGYAAKSRASAMRFSNAQRCFLNDRPRTRAMGKGETRPYFLKTAVQGKTNPEACRLPLIRETEKPAALCLASAALQRFCGGKQFWQNLCFLMSLAPARRPFCNRGTPCAGAALRSWA